jgi:hypothetical protein
MSKKIFIIFLFVSIQCFAGKLTFKPWENNSFLQLNSYNGNMSQNAFTVRFDGNGNVDEPKWRLSAQLKGAITSGSYTFPADKISFQPVFTTGSANPGPVPTIQQIGMPASVFLQENTEKYLVPSSNAPLSNSSNSNGPFYMEMGFSLTVAGGAYLGNYPAWTEFTVPVEMAAYDQYNNLIGKSVIYFKLQIAQLSGVPPTSTEMSLKLASNAVNGTLEFKTIQDYTNGVSVSYPSALIVKSNTNYQVKVKSIQGQFTSAAGSTLPLDTVQMVLNPVSGNTGSIFPISLSTSSQLVAKGGTTQSANVYFDIKYSTSANDNRFVQAKMEDYVTTIQYEIMPQ